MTILKCSAHPRYRAIHKPRVACEACWRIYIMKKDASPAETTLTAASAPQNRAVQRIARAMRPTPRQYYGE